MIEKINWEKVSGLVPAVIQDAETLAVLMLGYLNEASLQKTLQEGKVHFFSRTKNRIWMKGETSGNVLLVKSIHLDCDQDTLLIKVTPQGHTCHTGAVTCFHDDEQFTVYQLQRTIQKRIATLPENSYTTHLVQKGIARIAQKVGEEATETVIASLVEKEKLGAETADLLYHLFVLLGVSGMTLQDIEQILASRHKKS